MMGNFSKNATWGQKYPGKMIKSMAMYEVFFASRLYESKKSIERYKSDSYKMKIFGVIKNEKIHNKLKK